MNPDFFHIGYPRTGTTFLQSSIFKQCEDKIFFEKSKVPFFYKWKKEFKNNIYEDVSSSKVRNKIFLDTEEEFSGDMFRDNYQFPSHIYDINKNAKIIITVRSQYSILPSIYSLFIKKGGKLDFDEYIKIIVKNKKFDFSILYKEYLKFFKRKQILVLFFEELIKNPKTYVTKILNFMDIRNKKIDVSIQSHFKNASPGSEYIFFTLLFNKILNLEIPTRYMSIEKRKRVLNNLRKRRKFLHPIFFILNRFRSVLRRKKLQLNLKQKKLIKQTYSKSNQQFFEHIGNKTYRKNYP